jgi:hypothetical protein
MEVSANGAICGCTAGYVARPCIANANFGGANTATCGGPTQALVVICE